MKRRGFLSLVLGAPAAAKSGSRLIMKPRSVGVSTKILWANREQVRCQNDFLYWVKNYVRVSRGSHV